MYHSYIFVLLIFIDNTGMLKNVTFLIIIKTYIGNPEAKL